MKRKNICVVVLGDVGRSPRMQYHSQSFAEEGHIVDIVGYHGAPPIDSLKSQPLVSFHNLLPYPNIPLPRILNYIFKTIWQTLSLLFVLILLRTPDYIFVQNPPAIPTLIVCYIWKLYTKAKLVIDWHNYANSIMALNLGRKNHPLVILTKCIEFKIGTWADYNFCVTKNMKKDLKEKHKIEAETFYDRPPDLFKKFSIEEKHKVMLELSKEYENLKKGDGNVFYEAVEGGKVNFRESRPAMIISSTSWTEDEDFSILLRALEGYEKHFKTGNELKLPELICVITGKGPLKEFYLEKISSLNFKHVKIVTPWVKAEHYPILLSCADLGVSLHTSSSGLDLPMKVVDMFGCEIPVTALNFKCLGELLQHEINGLAFSNSDELTKQILSWFSNFPNNKLTEEKKEKFLKENSNNLRWRENWNNVVKPTLNL